jgi:cystathionine beta-lyase
VAQVLHPALAGSPGHEHWRALCTQDGQGGGASLAAGLFSVVFDARYTSGQVDAFCDALKLFKLGYSWGGPVSLVVPYDVASMRRAWPHKGVLVRFSLGLEAVQDLQADLAGALAVLAQTQA